MKTVNKLTDELLETYAKYLGWPDDDLSGHAMNSMALELKERRALDGIRRLEIEELVRRRQDDLTDEEIAEVAGGVDILEMHGHVDRAKAVRKVLRREMARREILDRAAARSITGGHSE